MKNTYICCLNYATMGSVNASFLRVKADGEELDGRAEETKEVYGAGS